MIAAAFIAAIGSFVCIWSTLALADIAKASERSAHALERIANAIEKGAR